MRTIAFTNASMLAATLLGAALLLGAGAAAAKPASVTVSVSPELQAEAERNYGVRDVRELAEDLRKDVERQTAGVGVLDGAHIVLEITDAKPNRPTFKQLSDHPPLSFQSFSVGGATIDGHAVLPNGKVVPLSFRYWETDIRAVHLAGVWADAESAFDQFAHRLGHGELVADR
jgi:hypothetical protein